MPADLAALLTQRLRHLEDVGVIKSRPRDGVANTV